MDSFISNLSEKTTIAKQDYTVFDAQDVNSGTYNTSKISYDTLYKQLCADVTTGLATKFSTIDSNIAAATQAVNSKLSKTGLNGGLSEKMTGTLLIDNVAFSATGFSHFTKKVDLHSNKIINVLDPSDFQDVATKNYVDTKFGNIPLPSTSSFLQKSGDTMNSGKILTLGADPVNPMDSTTLQSVTAAINTAKTSITTDVKSYVSSNYLPLSGGTITGSVSLKGFSEQTPSSISPVSNVLSLDLKQGNTFSINLNANVNSFNLTNVPTDSFTITLFITIVGNFTITWTINGIQVKWPSGATPILTTTASRVDVICLTKISNVWYGFIGGQNFQ